MRKLILMRVLSLMLVGVGMLSTAHATEYTITGSGIYFSHSETERTWPKPAKEFLRSCKDTNYNITTSTGGRGIVLRECWTPSSPYGSFSINTRMYDNSHWPGCTKLGIDNGILELICPRVFR